LVLIGVEGILMGDNAITPLNNVLCVMNLRNS
jgi:hypothetical protein